MNVNGFTSSFPTTYNKTNSSKENTTFTNKKTTNADALIAEDMVQSATTKASNKLNGTSAIYDASSSANSLSINSTTDTTNIISQLQADADARIQQLKSIVEKLMTQQGDAYGKANDMWHFLADGNFKVDAATKAQAKEDISEDGYWGVEQTSDRIVDFAKTISGGDPSKMEEMLSAFKDGFKQATETWGKELPEISQQTYDAVIEKFDKWQADNTTTV